MVWLTKSVIKSLRGQVQSFKCVSESKYSKAVLSESRTLHESLVEKTRVGREKQEHIKLRLEMWICQCSTQKM